jgi:single-stranded-DNA-specific exonuclease
MGTTIWNRRPVEKTTVDGLINKSGVPSPIATVLAARGITAENYAAYITPQLSDLTDPFMLPGILEASERIWSAITKKEKILIFGDYDTDGVTSTAILIKTLSENGGEVSYFLPHRFEDGYGFTIESLEKIIKETRPSLIITVDCGINGVETVAEANKSNIDVIITDHHEPGDEIPDALAVVNPKLHNNINNLNVLAGVGISFKLCHGFIKYGRKHNLGGNRTDLKQILDLVALGTVADIVPLLGENRILVNSGLKVLATQIRPGIRALCESTKINAEVTPTHIAFNLAPKLNAAGRFGSPEEALKLLKTDNIVEAYKISETLNSYNILRKKTENEIYIEAASQLASQEVNGNLEGAAVVSGNDWHQGVIGIVASRLSRDYFRPSIVLSIEGDTASGSGRSIGNISLIDILNDTSEYLIRYGGHPLAAGLTLETKKIPEFFEAFNKSLKKYSTPDHFIPSIDFDGELKLSELNKNFFEHLKKLEPFGCGNREPVFRINGLTPTHTAVAAEKHTRGTLCDTDGHPIQFIAFNQHISSMPSSEKWDVIATPQINKFRGTENYQLQIVDFKESGTA